MQNVALLLDDSRNRYQQLLAREAAVAAARHGIALAAPLFAEGSAWKQVELANACLRQQKTPDGMVMMLAGGQSARAPIERMLKAGVSLVLLNRVPNWFSDLQRTYREVLAAAVAPRQEWIGRLQARQAARLVARGAAVLLVTGTASSVAALERRDGFLAEASGRFAVQGLDGGWSAEAAQTALSRWFQLTGGRGRVPDLVVCQNDAMAAGARAALLEQAERTNRPELTRVPLIGCDGLPDEGRASVIRGDLAATVMMPVTTTPALGMLRRYWDHGEQAGVELLDAESFPRLEEIRPSTC